MFMKLRFAFLVVFLFLSFKGHSEEGSNLNKVNESSADVMSLADTAFGQSSSETVNLSGTVVRLFSGSSGGTYIRIAKDIAQLSYSFKVAVEKSKGSYENIESLLKYNDTNIAIIQYDALLLARGRIGPKVDNIKLLLSLYPEEIHVIAHKDSQIKSLKDLDGKKVNIGEKGSGSWVTSRVMVTKIGQIWRESFFPFKESLNKLIKREIDATLIVIGKPAPILSSISQEDQNKLKLVELEHPKLKDIYPQAQIDANVYPWHKESIKTYSVQSVLIGLNEFVDKKTKAKNDKMVKELYDIVSSNITSIGSEGHPKWSEVELSRINKLAWPTHPALLLFYKY